MGLGLCSFAVCDYFMLVVGVGFTYFTFEGLFCLYLLLRKLLVVAFCLCLYFGLFYFGFCWVFEFLLLCCDYCVFFLFIVCVCFLLVLCWLFWIFCWFFNFCIWLVMLLLLMIFRFGVGIYCWQFCWLLIFVGFLVLLTCCLFVYLVDCFFYFAGLFSWCFTCWL